MKKTIKFSAVVLCVISALASCKKADSVVISQKEDLQVGPAATELVVNVEASSDWTVKSSESWATVTPTANSFRLVVSANDGLEGRSCDITVNCGEAVASFKVSQSALIANVKFTAPSTISYDITGTVEGDYVTGLFDKAAFESYAEEWNGGDKLLAFYQVADGFMASKDIKTVSEVSTVKWEGITVSFGMGFYPGVDIKAGGEYLVLVCSKKACEDNDKEAKLYEVVVKAE